MQVLSKNEQYMKTSNGILVESSRFGVRESGLDISALAKL
jgi:hypothetical protein